ncbi:RraA family protein [Microbacterium telephonicum]|uniref:Putative 4-hydroxy-4-methyl-2-oxoglutarate aldolase n=1 Tax=Microbacterium telephonicum TaxID=1714841 RepID=A0A498BSS0_9MICO|nr:RraA family protein [Microbacterium telephonicum]RLK46582.1 regulator of RNase E activity RraA [Microbacterium telephonicum]
MSSADGFRPEPGDERLTSAIVSDSCDAAGMRHQVLRGRLAPLVAGTRTIGRARTVRFAPSLVDDPADPYGAAIDMIDGIGAGQIAVIATGESDDSAFWGELFSAAALGAGAVGVVTDGPLRDTDKIAALGFPAFSRSRRPIDFRARMRVVDVDAPVEVGGVRIESGDLVIADDDGIVVVPRAAESDVLARARARASAETTVLAELLAGDSLRAVWTRHGIL